MRLGSTLRAALLRNPVAYGLARRLVTIGRYLGRRVHEPDFNYFRRRKDDGLFLDIGANAGQSALSFRVVNRRARILSIEPNPAHSTDLAFIGRLVRRFEYRIAAAAESPGKATLFVPRYHGVALTGEASLRREEARRSFWVGHHTAGSTADVELEEIEVHTLRLDDLGLSPSIVKIDVEGTELAVLKGLEITLARSRPILLIENSLGFDGVHSWLAARDYVPRAYDDAMDELVPLGQKHPLNVFFVPVEPSADGSPHA